MIVKLRGVLNIPPGFKILANSQRLLHKYYQLSSMLRLYILHIETYIRRPRIYPEDLIAEIWQ